MKNKIITDIANGELNFNYGLMALENQKYSKVTSLKSKQDFKQNPSNSLAEVLVISSYAVLQPILRI
jgi:hypothetical protein